MKLISIQAWAQLPFVLMMILLLLTIYLTPTMPGLVFATIAVAIALAILAIVARDRGP